MTRKPIGGAPAQMDQRIGCCADRAARTEFLAQVDLLVNVLTLAADDQAALKIAIQLVQDAGFEPVVVGPLARAKEFDTGTPVYGKALTAAELRRGLGMGS